MRVRTSLFPLVNKLLRVSIIFGTLNNLSLLCVMFIFGAIVGFVVALFVPTEKLALLKAKILSIFKKKENEA